MNCMGHQTSGSFPIRSCATRVRLVFRLVAVVLLASGLADPARCETRGAANSILVFGGWGTDTNFAQVIYAPWTVDLVDLGVVAASYSTRIGTVSALFGDPHIGNIGEDVTVEAEVGISGRFGQEDLGELWTALYLRYDGFPWNDAVFTTLGVNTGLSMLTEKSEFEEGRDDKGKSSRLLHYLAPEITLADPDNKNLEFVLRLHHRSGVFGVFDGVVSGSTFISSGIRFRF